MKILCWIFGHRFVRVGWSGLQAEHECRRCGEPDLYTKMLRDMGNGWGGK